MFEELVGFLTTRPIAAGALVTAGFAYVSCVLGQIKFSRYCLGIGCTLLLIEVIRMRLTS